MAIPIQVVIDCADLARLAAFWASALDYVIQPPPTGFGSWVEFLTAQGFSPDRFNDRSAVVDPKDVGPRIFFQKVPEPKTVKNRVHVDVNVGTGLEPDAQRVKVGATVERLVAEGASVVQTFDEGEHWVVLQDPEGNEFCVQ